MAIAQSTYATDEGGEIAALRALLEHVEHVEHVELEELEERGADVLIAVRNSCHKGFQVIKDRLTYGGKTSHQASKHERGHGRDITWTIRAMPALPWVVEN